MSTQSIENTEATYGAITYGELFAAHEEGFSLPAYRAARRSGATHAELVAKKDQLLVDRMITVIRTYRLYMAFTGMPRCDAVIRTAWACHETLEMAQVMLKSETS